MKPKAVRFRSGILLLLLAPSLLGLLLFYIAPFLVSAYSAFIDNPSARNFIGFENFRQVITNAAFGRAVGNTALFTVLCIPLNMIFPLCLAMLLGRVRRYRNILWLVFLLPLVIPSGSMLSFWQKTFGLNGWINGLFFADAPRDWLNTGFARSIVVFIFIWKNAGYNMVLFFAGLNFIPREYYECASVEGAGAWHKFWRITLVYLTPTAFLVFIMSFINSFKAFKEIYMLSGAYPHESVYMLQHYMYNQFTATNYQRLTSSSYIVTLCITGLVLAFFFAQKKVGENF